jgi:hypothetical protein
MKPFVISLLYCPKAGRRKGGVNVLNSLSLHPLQEDERGGSGWESSRNAGCQHTTNIVGRGAGELFPGSFRGLPLLFNKNVCQASQEHKKNNLPWKKIIRNNQSST